MEDFYPARRIGQCMGAELWVGSARDAADERWLQSHRIGLVVNCTRHLPCASAPSRKCIRVAVHDDPAENASMLAALPSACKEIARALENGLNVLVHCHAGVSRSASVAAAALVYMRIGSLDSVIRNVRHVKPETLPVGFAGEPNFMPALREWERRCHARLPPAMRCQYR